jgi:phosphate transport system substrate-binding protein
MLNFYCFGRHFFGLAALIFAFAASPALSGEVTLRLKTGGLTITGRLVDHNDQFYMIENDALGVMWLSPEKFRCDGAACPQLPNAERTGVAVQKGEPVHISGSTTIGAKLMPALIERYAEKIGAKVEAIELDDADLIFDLIDRSGARIVTIGLKRHGSATAFAALASGEADIGMSDRSITEEEIATLAGAGLPGMNRPGHEHVVGQDGILVVTSPGNRVSALSIEELSRIFSGEVKDWSELGLPRQKINVYATDEKSGTFRMFRSLVLRPFGKTLMPDARRLRSNADLAKEVAADRGGIGIASFAEIDLAKPVAIKGSCGLAHQPSRFGVKSGEYPFSRNLYFYTPDLTKTHVAGLVELATSRHAAEILEDVGFIDKSVTATPFDSFAEQLANSINVPAKDFDFELMRQLMSDLGAGHRLSSTMHFESGLSQLDSESLQQMPDLVDYLQRQDLSGRKIVIAGFSDNTGAFARNLQLSRERAEAVRDALTTADDGALRSATIEVNAYGELFPVVCNDSERRREKNRRVEIWLVSTDASRPLVLKEQ